LIVDDETDTTFVFSTILEAEGYTVDVYNDPIKALTAYKPGYYDLIILDYGMPSLNGSAFIQKIRSIDRSAKAILVTAWDLRLLGNEIQKYFIKILRKPITEEELIKEVELALNRVGETTG
jgi:CheY-like chemotaxis protein